MYTQDFYIDSPVGNNAFSFDERENKKLFVPKLKKIGSFDEIKLLNSPRVPLDGGGSELQSEQGEKKITFEEYDFDGNMQICFGLENLYRLDWRGKPLYLVDNHNHVFYFWYLARSQGIILDGALLYHIDEHADTRDPGKYLMKPESEDLQKVFEYTNFFLNVGNYIIPAEKEGIIGETIQIRSEEALKEYISTQSPHPNPLPGGRGNELHNKQEMQPLSPSKEREFKSEGDWKKQSIILNLDLDFFEPELDFINYDLKKQVILDIAQKADLITVCTSPYFIDQERALDVFRDLFKN